MFIATWMIFRQIYNQKLTSFTYYSNAPITDHIFWTGKRPLLISTNFWNWKYRHSFSMPIRRIYQSFWGFISVPIVASYEGTTVYYEPLFIPYSFQYNFRPVGNSSVKNSNVLAYFPIFSNS